MLDELRLPMLNVPGRHLASSGPRLWAHEHNAFQEEQKTKIILLTVCSLC